MALTLPIILMKRRLESGFPGGVHFPGGARWLGFETAAQFWSSSRITSITEYFSELTSGTADFLCQATFGI